MNEQARKRARRAELTHVLLNEWWKYRDDLRCTKSFVEWLEDQSDNPASWWRDEAKELIALYGEEG